MITIIRSRDLFTCLDPDLLHSMIRFGYFDDRVDNYVTSAMGYRLSRSISFHCVFNTDAGPNFDGTIGGRFTLRCNHMHQMKSKAGDTYASLRLNQNDDHYH